jgi:hypothetical protein
LDPHLDVSREWRVVGDETRLRRIYANLVENALRYSPRGSTVTVRVEAEGRDLRACVDDEGPGLPPGESAGRLFALFSQDTEGGGKAGLGLYFCRITVERWGGAIGCESRPQGGARFWFRVPRAEGVAGSGIQQRLRAHPAQGIQRAAPAAPAGSAIDEAELLKRVDHDWRLLVTLIEIFRDNAPRMMMEIAAAIRQHNPVALHNAAVALIPSLENFGALAALDVARQLEQMGREGRLGGAGEPFASLEAEVAKVTSALVALASAKAADG